MRTPRLASSVGLAASSARAAMTSEAVAARATAMPQAISLGRSGRVARIAVILKAP
jgi:hypothetical protein